MISKILAAARFDLTRSLRPGRVAIVFVLSMFPPSIALITTLNGAYVLAPIVIGVTTMMVGVLALLLWATPVVYQEMEGKTWTYISVRPEGKVSLLLGKYLMAVVWAICVCWIAMTLAVTITEVLHNTLDPDITQKFGPTQQSEVDNPDGAPSVGLPTAFDIWWVYTVLIVLAAFSYAALFLLFGVIFHRRSMVLAVAYIIFFEFGVAFVPAVVNKITMQHHLTSMAVKLLGIDALFEAENIDPEVIETIGIAEPLWHNVAFLVAFPLLVMGGTIFLIRNGEYITADEN